MAQPERPARQGATPGIPEEVSILTRVVAIAALLMFALASFAAAAAPVVTSPANGDKIGPNVLVTGSTEGKQFVIIITDVYLKGKDAPIKSVPGIRHWTNDDGTFCFGISTPRVPWYPSADLTYKIRVFTQRPGQEKGEVTVITCYKM